MNAPLDTNPHETRLRSTELRDDKKCIEELEAVSEEDKHTFRELQATIRELQATVQERDDTIQGLQDTVQERDDTIQELQDTVQERDDTIQGLQDTVQERDDTIQELQDTVQERDDTLKEMQQHWQKAEDSLQKANQNPSDFISFKDIDDNVIRRKLNTLSTRIEENFANKNFSGPPMKTFAKADIKILFDRITPDWAKRYLKDERRKQYFIEAVIWHKLIDTFLKHPLTILSEDMGAALYDIHSELWRRFNTSIYVNIVNVPTGSKPLEAEKLQDYHSARLKMAELHIRVKGKNGLYLGDGKTAVVSKAELAADLGAMLSNYTSKTKTSEYQTELQIIVQLAVDLAESMAMAKAHYAVRMGTSLYSDKVHGFTFRPGSMESIAGPVRDNEVVELVVSPVLVKCGTSEGVDYDRLNVLEKARVFCK
ncbi:hypothetical protein PG990_013115 [Apiospora arundinis]